MSATDQPLYGLRYAGGKSHIARGTGKWIAGLLPKSTTYIEPFAGMLGVLLKLPKSTVEIANDRNSRLVNWWRCLRDDTDELLRLVTLTPNARDAFCEATDRIDDPALSDLERAAAFHIVIAQAYGSDDSQLTRGNWMVRFLTAPQAHKRQHARLLAVANRIIDIQIENRCAVELLERTAKIADATIYCDPPYHDTPAKDRFYLHSVDRGDLTEVLKIQKGKVAISGYRTDWDHLDWYRLERDTYCLLSQRYEAETSRSEVLWVNYPTVQPVLF